MQLKRHMWYIPPPMFIIVLIYHKEKIAARQKEYHKKENLKTHECLAADMWYIPPAFLAAMNTTPEAYHRLGTHPKP